MLSILGVLAGMSSPLGLLGCKLCKSHSKASLSTLRYFSFTAVFFFMM